MIAKWRARGPRCACAFRGPRKQSKGRFHGSVGVGVRAWQRQQQQASKQQAPKNGYVHLVEGPQSSPKWMNPDLRDDRVGGAMEGLMEGPCLTRHQKLPPAFQEAWPLPGRTAWGGQAGGDYHRRSRCHWGSLPHNKTPGRRQFRRSSCRQCPLRVFGGDGVRDAQSVHGSGGVGNSAGGVLLPTAPSHFVWLRPVRIPSEALEIRPGVFWHCTLRTVCTTT